MGTNWLITYSQINGRGDEIIANKRIEGHPADWLIQTMERFPSADTKLLFAMEINEEQDGRLRNFL